MGRLDIEQRIINLQKELVFYERQTTTVLEYGNNKKNIINSISNMKRELKSLEAGLKEIKEIEKHYLQSYGNWRVMTEGDVEGGSLRVIGTFIGQLDTIAYNFAKESYYSLWFTKLLSLKKYCEHHGSDIILVPKEITTRNDSIPKEVHVQLDIDSGTWGMNKKETRYRIDFFKQILKDRPAVEVTDSNYYASVKLSFS